MTLVYAIVTIVRKIYDFSIFYSQYCEKNLTQIFTYSPFFGGGVPDFINICVFFNPIISYFVNSLTFFSGVKWGMNKWICILLPISLLYVSLKLFYCIILFCFFFPIWGWRDWWNPHSDLFLFKSYGFKNKNLLEYSRCTVMC